MQSDLVDEVLIPSKSHTSIIQYKKSKPHKWEIRMFSRCGLDGMDVWFWELYRERNNPKKSNLGNSGDIVSNLGSKHY